LATLSLLLLHTFSFSSPSSKSNHEFLSSWKLNTVWKIGVAPTPSHFCHFFEISIIYRSVNQAKEAILN
jgi:hypothetical protein